MAQFSVHEAKTHLSRLLKRVAAGEEIIIARGGRPVARLAAIGPVKSRHLGRDLGLFEVDDDFDDELPESVMKEFEG